VIVICVPKKSRGGKRNRRIVGGIGRDSNSRAEKVPKGVGGKKPDVLTWGGKETRPPLPGNRMDLGDWGSSPGVKKAKPAPVGAGWVFELWHFGQGGGGMIGMKKVCTHARNGSVKRMKGHYLHENGSTTWGRWVRVGSIRTHTSRRGTDFRCFISQK